MEETNALESLHREFPTMESFLDKFPTLKNYIISTDSYGKQIMRLNNVIANIRHMLGWSLDPAFSSSITDINTNKNMHELAKFNGGPVLELILKCVVHILWTVTEDAFSSPALFEDECIEVNLDDLKKRIYSQGTKELYME